MMGIHPLYLLEDAAPLVDQVCNNVTFCRQDVHVCYCWFILQVKINHHLTCSLVGHSGQGALGHVEEVLGQGGESVL